MVHAAARLVHAAARLHAWAPPDPLAVCVSPWPMHAGGRGSSGSGMPDGCMGLMGQGARLGPGPPREGVYGQTLPPQGQGHQRPPNGGAAGGGPAAGVGCSQEGDRGRGGSAPVAPMAAAPGASLGAMRQAGPFDDGAGRHAMSTAAAAAAAAAHMRFGNLQGSPGSSGGSGSPGGDNPSSSSGRQARRQARRDEEEAEEEARAMVRAMHDGSGGMGPGAEMDWDSLGGGDGLGSDGGGDGPGGPDGGACMAADDEGGDDDGKLQSGPGRPQAPPLAPQQRSGGAGDGRQQPQKAHRPPQQPQQPQPSHGGRAAGQGRARAPLSDAEDSFNNDGMLGGGSVACPAPALHAHLGSGQGWGGPAGGPDEEPDDEAVLRMLC
jgi:hypothetical protein